MEEACYSGLCLGLAVGGCEKCNNNTDNEPKSDDIRNGSELRERSISLSLGPSSAMSTEEDDREGEEEEEEEKEEDPMPVDQVTAPGGPNNPRSTDGNSLDGSRKKLMLSKDQLALLEEAFRHHRNLTADKKRQLADQLNLKPRQVEIWFQNRRARSKLKQMESQLVQLRKECERLSNENQRLKKELDESRSSKGQPSSSLVQPPGSNPSTPPLCSSCLKIIEEAEERD